ncbi:hypothetical protein BDZ89DRAFT_1145398 [Hymenopellis radicata]|nr:hypothetical protein BDZ89DRAFT_1145398 [Hymenopellis radicata]
MAKVFFSLPAPFFVAGLPAKYFWKLWWAGKMTFQKTFASGLFVDSIVPHHNYVAIRPRRRCSSSSALHPASSLPIATTRLCCGRNLRYCCPSRAMPRTSSPQSYAARFKATIQQFSSRLPKTTVAATRLCRTTRAPHAIFDAGATRACSVVLSEPPTTEPAIRDQRALY